MTDEDALAALTLDGVDLPAAVRAGGLAIARVNGMIRPGDMDVVEAVVYAAAPIIADSAAIHAHARAVVEAARHRAAFVAACWDAIGDRHAWLDSLAADPLSANDFRAWISHVRERFADLATAMP